MNMISLDKTIYRYIVFVFTCLFMVVAFRLPAIRMRLQNACGYKYLYFEHAQFAYSSL